MEIQLNDVLSATCSLWLRVTGLRQEDLGARIGLTQRTISHRLSGRSRWTLEDLERLSRAGVIEWSLRKGSQWPDERVAGLEEGAA